MIKKFVKSIIYREKSSSEKYIKFLRDKGVTIGNDCIFYSPKDSFVDIQYPWMIKIGNHVRITSGVKIITHDFSWSVLKLYSNEKIKSGSILGASGKIVIGDNVFIGINSIITRNVNIGNNVIIGAGSVVTKDCLSNGVYAGNPAKFLMTIDDFYKKRQELQLKEGKKLAIEYYRKFKNIPPKYIFNEYFLLFEENKDIEENKDFMSQVNLCGNGNETLKNNKMTERIFDNYESFIKYCFSEEGKEKK